MEKKIIWKIWGGGAAGVRGRKDGEGPGMGEEGCQDELEEELFALLTDSGSPSVLSCFPVSGRPSQNVIL